MRGLTVGLCVSSLVRTSLRVVELKLACRASHDYLGRGWHSFLSSKFTVGEYFVASIKVGEA